MVPYDDVPSCLGCACYMIQQWLGKVMDGESKKESLFLTQCSNDANDSTGPFITWR